MFSCRTLSTQALTTQWRERRQTWWTLPSSETIITCIHNMEHILIIIVAFFFDKETDILFSLSTSSQSASYSSSSLSGWIWAWTSGQQPTSTPSQRSSRPTWLQASHSTKSTSKNGKYKSSFQKYNALWSQKSFRPTYLVITLIKWVKGQKSLESLCSYVNQWTL